jgi:hypothetical protein
MKPIARTPATTAAPPSRNDEDFIAERPPRKAGIAARILIGCGETGLPHD